MKQKDNLDKITEDVRKSLELKDSARERAIPLSRDAIRFCSNAIRAVHRQEFAEARRMLASARKMLKEARLAIKECGELANRGFIRDAEKEYAEGSAVLALVTGKKVPHIISTINLKLLILNVGKVQSEKMCIIVKVDYFSIA